LDDKSDIPAPVRLDDRGVWGGGNGLGHLSDWRAVVPIATKQSAQYNARAACDRDCRHGVVGEYEQPSVIKDGLKSTLASGARQKILKPGISE
jgi:hypothetical protein